MPKTFYNGWSGGFAIDGTDVDITEWSGEESCPSADVTTTGDYDATMGHVYTKRWKTRRSFTGSISFPVEATIDMAQFRAGEKIADVTLDEGGGRVWTFPSIYIASNPVATGGMDDVNRRTIAFENDGVYYGPDDTVPPPETP